MGDGTNRISASAGGGGHNMSFPWHPDDGSEAQNIIRQAEAPPDSPFRPRFRRRSGEIAVPVGFGAGATGTIAPPAMGANNNNGVQAIKLGVLLGKKPIADALSCFLSLRDVFKMGASCRELMRRLMTVGGAEGGAGSAAAPELGAQQQQQQAAGAAAADAVAVANDLHGEAAAADAGAGPAGGVVAAAAGAAEPAPPG